MENIFFFSLNIEVHFLPQQVLCLSNIVNLTLEPSRSSESTYLNTYNVNYIMLKLFALVLKIVCVLYFSCRYPPKVPFSNFNDHSQLSDEEKKIRPR